MGKGRPRKYIDEKPKDGEVIPTAVTNNITPPSVIDSGEVQMPEAPAVTSESTATPPPEFEEPIPSVPIPVEVKKREKIEVDKEALYRIIGRLVMGLPKTMLGVPAVHWCVGDLWQIKDTDEKIKKWEEIHQWLVDKETKG